MKRRKPLSRKALQALLCPEIDPKNQNPASATIRKSDQLAGLLSFCISALLHLLHFNKVRRCRIEVMLMEYVDDILVQFRIDGK